MRQLHAIIYGRVQGVSFRYNAQREGERQGLVGWVRNLPDGSVETLAVGSDDSLEAFEQWLRHGPPGAFVSEVEVSWDNTTETFTAFEIRYGSDYS